MTDTEPAVLARLHPSAPRRIIGVSMLGALALVVASLGQRLPGENAVIKVVVYGMAVLAIWAAWRLWRATSVSLILTDDALRDSSGRLLARVADIAEVDRGALALKPAGGFTLIMRETGPRMWEPGLWWRMGKKIGVGGVIHRNEARFMAEKVAAMVSDH